MGYSSDRSGGRRASEDPDALLREIEESYKINGSIVRLIAKQKDALLRGAHGRPYIAGADELKPIIVGLEKALHELSGSWLPPFALGQAWGAIRRAGGRSLPPWGHKVRILDRIDGRQIRLWSLQQALEHDWSRTLMR